MYFVSYILNVKFKHWSIKIQALTSPLFTPVQQNTSSSLRKQTTSILELESLWGIGGKKGKTELLFLLLWYISKFNLMLILTWGSLNMNYRSVPWFSIVCSYLLGHNNFDPVKITCSRNTLMSEVLNRKAAKNWLKAADIYKSKSSSAKIYKYSNNFITSGSRNWVFLVRSGC